MMGRPASLSYLLSFDFFSMSNSLELHALLVGVKAPVYRTLVNENRRVSSPVVTQHIRLIVSRAQQVRRLDF